MTAAPPSRPKLVASGVFFIGYLGFQVIYPALAWVRPGFDHFTWHMYAGLSERPQLSVVMADGTTREVGNPMRRGNVVRVLGPQVDLARFGPPYLCTAWPGARLVTLHYPRSGRADVVSCPAR